MYVYVTLWVLRATQKSTTGYLVKQINLGALIECMSYNVQMCTERGHTPCFCLGSQQSTQPYAEHLTETQGRRATPEVFIGGRS